MVMVPTPEMTVLPPTAPGSTVTVVPPTTNWVTVLLSPASVSVSLASKPVAAGTVNVVSSSMLLVSLTAIGAAFVTPILMVAVSGKPLPLVTV